MIKIIKICNHTNRFQSIKGHFRLLFEISWTPTFSCSLEESLHNQVQFLSNPRLKYLSLSKAHVLKCLWPKYSASQFTTLGRRSGSGGTEPPLAGSREYLNPQSSAPRRTRGQIQREREREREREMSFLLFCPIKLLLSPVVRGGGAQTPVLVLAGERGKLQHIKYWI